MTAQEFCYWLQGHLEISGTTFLSGDQVEVIKDHLGLVFQKVTPQRGLKHVAPVLLDDSRPMPGCSGRIPGSWPAAIPLYWGTPPASC